MSKIEVVKQQDLKDCGACSLLCIIKYYKGYVPLEKIREDTYTNLNGTTAFHLIEAAKKYGFDAMGVKVNKIEDKNIYLPAIAHVILKNGLQHFVVIYKITNDHLYIMDPAKGKVKLKKAEFEEIWDHVLILLSPINQIIQYQKNINLPLIFLKLFSCNKGLFIKICLSNSLLMLVTIFSNFYFQISMESIEGGKEIPFIRFIVLLFLIVYVFKILFEYLKNYYLSYLNKNIDTTVFTSFIEHIFHLPLNFIQNRTTGEIVSRVQELDEIKNMASEIFTNFILNLILIIGSIVVLMIISSKLFFVLCIVIALYLLIGLLFSKWIYQKVKIGVEYATDFNSDMVEYVDMFPSIKNLNLVKEFLYHLESKLILMLKNNFELTKFMNKLETGKSAIYELGLFAVNTFGIYLIFQEKLSIYNLITFNSLILYLFNPIKELVELVPRYEYLKATFQKLYDFLAIEEEKSIGFQTSLQTSINATHLSYSYNQYTNILNDLHFQIKEHEKVLLCGPSGCGKSTICKLLSRYYTNYLGKIEFGSVSEKDYSLKTIREKILYVGQNEKLFSGTIKENIQCFRKVNDKMFMKVSRICKIQEIVNKRPNRYETFIHASLNNLSGGEKQRIILARALLKNADILIIDEALSEVNIEMERSILNDLFKYFPDKTILYVSHKDVSNEFQRIVKIC